MPGSPSSLTARVGFAPQPLKGTPVATPLQMVDGISFESMPQFDYIENEFHMRGVHQRATANQTAAEKSSVMVPFDFEVGLYPLSLPYLLFGIGMVQGTPATALGITTHPFAKSNAQDAPYLTVYKRLGAGADAFTRRLRAARFSSLEVTLSRNQGSTARIRGMALDETGVAETIWSGATSEEDTQFQPFLGGLIWDTSTYSDYDFGLPREHVITFTRDIEEDDQYLHQYSRNDNQEMSFRLMGQMRGLEMSEALYSELFYGGAADITGAALDTATVFTGLTFELNTGQNIPAAAAPYKWIVNVPKCEIRMTNFRAQGNSIVRAEAQWKMIDDAATPPVKMEVTNAVATYPFSTALFTSAGGTAPWAPALPDATP